MLILRWFYEVVDANCWFLQWLWMTMVVFHWFLCEISPTTDPQPSWLRFGASRRRRRRSTFASEQPQATESDHAASPRLARSHARTKRNDFPVGVTKDSPPQPPIFACPRMGNANSVYKQRAGGRSGIFTTNGFVL